LALLIVVLLLLCPVICLVLYAKGRDTERRIVTSVEG